VTTVAESTLISATSSPAVVSVYPLHLFLPFSFPPRPVGTAEGDAPARVCPRYGPSACATIWAPLAVCLQIVSYFCFQRCVYDVWGWGLEMQVKYCFQSLWYRNWYLYVEDLLATNKINSEPRIGFRKEKERKLWQTSCLIRRILAVACHHKVSGVPRIFIRSCTYARRS
jgi:hypothetical protein